MKFLLIITVLVSFSCTISKKGAQSYYYVEPFKEQEIMFLLKNNSTFSFQDLTGCNQFVFSGQYKMKNDSAGSYLVFDSVQFQNVLLNSNFDLFFSIKSGDTAWIINPERIFINNLPFIATSRREINLQQIRYKKLKEYYTELLGRKGFIKTFGAGKGNKEAKKRLLDCRLPDINFK